MKALYVLGFNPYQWIYGDPERQRIAELVDVYAPAQTPASIADDPGVLADAEIFLSGWGCPTLTADLLDAAPNLKLVLYGAGTIKSVVTDEFWARGIPIVSAWHGNAVPVSEFALAHIFLGLKSVWQHVQVLRSEKAWRRLPIAGAYESIVGLVSLGAIGKIMVERLRTFDVKIIAYDPFVSTEQGAALGVEMVSLDELFRRADVVSLHTPWLKETEGLITGQHIASMKPYATFINTSRGAVVCEADMLAVLAQRPDLVAVIDVTYPEPPAADSPLYTLPNVVLTPHIAGAIGGECRRMGQMMIAELERFLAGQPLKWALSQEQVAIMA